jgi:protein SCO1
MSGDAPAGPPEDPQPHAGDPQSHAGDPQPHAGGQQTHAPGQKSQPAARRRTRPVAIISLLLAGAAVLWVGLTTDVTRMAGGENARAESGFRGAVLPDPVPKPQFTLADTEGRLFEFARETEGRLTLLFFGFTYCPDICPVHLANIAAVLADLPVEVRRDIRVVFVTGDPERDTPERVRQWLDAFDPNFIGLVGSLAEVNVILEDLRLPPVVYGPRDARGNYSVGHSAHVLAFTPDGYLRVIYPFGTRQVDWAHDLPKLAGHEFGRDADDPGPVASLLKPGMAYVPVPAAGGPASLYVTIANRAATADTLLGASTRVAGSVELHRSTTTAGAVMMAAVSAAPVEPGDSLRLVPGGYHLMLHDLTGSLAAGDTFTVELRFRRAGRIPVQAVVVPYSALERMLGAAANTGHGEH